jgi:hypothetical protein
MCEVCQTLLSEGLDLCVRARKMDSIDRANTMVEASSDPGWWTEENLACHAARHSAIWPDHPMATKSATLAVWVLDQYEKDLAGWERRGRQHLMQGCGAAGQAQP